MSRIAYSILAREDVAGIASYTCLTAVRDRLKMLRHFPRAGKQRDDLLPGLWGYPVKPFVIFYRLKPGDVVFIVRVIHGRRDIKAMFQP